MASTRRKTLEEFIADARKVHGDKYDYSLIKEYVNNKTKVPIKCNRCGEVFWCKPNVHLNGCNCSYCWAKEKPQFGKRKLVYGVATLDIDFASNADDITHKAYGVWYNMLQRCYYKKYQESHPTYIGCTVCDEWLYFSNFLNWFKKNYIDGYVVDKDLLVSGNKIYSPSTCCMIPSEINAMIVTRRRKSSRFGKGVSITRKGRFAAFLVKYNKTYNLGHFDTIEEAFEAYKQGKVAYVREVADSYFMDGKITKEVYDALYRYEPKIKD